MYRLFYIFFLLFVINLFPIIAQGNGNKQVTYLKEPNRTGFTSYDFGSSAPTRFENISRISFPEIKDLRLKFPSYAPSYYSGPDGGEVYLWKKDFYKWTRTDGSVFTEFENGTWTLLNADGSVFTSFAPCNGCLPGSRIDYKDGTTLLRNWVVHRKEYDWIFQKTKVTPALNWKLVDTSKVQPIVSNVSKYTFYHSASWDLYILGLKESFPTDSFFSYMKSEFDIENAGQIPVILFEKGKEMSDYQGKELPNGTTDAGGGFGGQDSITVCCGNSQTRIKADPVIDDYEKRKVYYGTFFHEAVHNLEQMTCLSYRVGKENLKPYNPEPWFNEGIANYAIAPFFSKKQHETYEQMDSLIKQKKIPSGYAALLKQGYNGLLPYSLGAYMVEYLHKKYGKNKFIQINKDICLGASAAETIERTVGLTGDGLLTEAVADFNEKKSSLLSDLNKKSVQGYTVMSPSNASEFNNFLNSGIRLPGSPHEIQNYEEIPSVIQIFRARVEPYLKKVWGVFDGPGESTFFLWESGIYKWTGPNWEATYYPGNQAVFKKDGWSVIEWENGMRRLEAPDKSYVIFWKKDQKGYFDKDGKEVK
ncbi:hypothetical protein [Leptospira sp. 'Mane']|uniref:hypothetical protein n=1 Tax=Leptospira sp. 'Mane' TaxID=3387407 RepID=UPI00398ABDF9